MQVTDSAEVAHRVATVATYGGSGVAVFFGFTPGEWQVIGIVGGLIVGVVGLAINAMFQYLNYRRGAK